MKVGGQAVTAPSEGLLVFPRDGHPLVFRSRALPDMDEFYKLCPEPKPPGRLTKEGWIPLPNEPGFASIMENHTKQRVGYMVTRTLAPSNIEWDTVDFDNPKTWPNWETDLKAAGMTHNELLRISLLVMEANGLSEAKLVEAREVFLRGQATAPESSSSPPTEPAST